MKAVGFIKLSDNRCYIRLIQELQDHHMFGNDLYPSTLNNTFEMLQNHSISRRGRQQPATTSVPTTSSSSSRSQLTMSSSSTSHIGFSYHQNNNLIAGDNGRVFPNVKYCLCKNKGHFNDHCPTANTDGAPPPSLSAEQHHQQGIICLPTDDNNANDSFNDSLEIGFHLEI